jgi:hypothetical protein
MFPLEVAAATCNPVPKKNMTNSSAHERQARGLRIENQIAERRIRLMLTSSNRATKFVFILQSSLIPKDFREALIA